MNIENVENNESLGPSTSRCTNFSYLSVGDDYFPENHPESSKNVHARPGMAEENLARKE